MKNFFISGGPIIMSILSVLLIFILILSMYVFYLIKRKEIVSSKYQLNLISICKSAGLLAMVLGILHQLLGFYHAFSVISEVGDVAPSLFFAGLKLSFISTIYGVSIYLVSIFVSILLKLSQVQESRFIE